MLVGYAARDRIELLAGDLPDDAEITKVMLIAPEPPLEPLRVAGLGFAVGDGHAEVRSAADRVVGACADGAVADAVELLFQLWT